MVAARFICIVDDTPDYQLLLQEVFKRSLPAYHVRFFSGGQALLDGLSRMTLKPSLILLDRHMPLLDGHQTLVQLKQQAAYHNIPVVMMSADASAVEVKGCYETGANSFVSKTFEFNSLRDTMSSICHYWLEVNQEAING